MTPEEKRKYDREYYAKRAPEAKERKIRLQLKRRRINRQLLNDYKSATKCKCGEDHPACLEFHHVNDDKEGNVSNLMTSSFDTIMKEVNKCILLCANCHRKLHYSVDA